MCGLAAVRRRRSGLQAPGPPPSAAGPATDSQFSGFPLQGFSRSTAASPSKQPSQNDWLLPVSTPDLQGLAGITGE